MTSPREELLARTYEARDGYCRQLGEVEPDVFAPLMNSAFRGGPRWPDLRQAFRVIRHGDSTIVVSDGLSDPFDDQEEPNVGFGLEVVGETTDPMPPGTVQNDWLFWTVYDVAQQVAGHGGVRDLIDELGVLSMEILARFGPEELVTPEGRLGLLLGLRPPEWPAEWQLPAGTVKILTVKVLHPSELAVAVEQEAAGRHRLQELFAADGSYHVSSTTRPAVV
jgi:hypothetical protein